MQILTENNTDSSRNYNIEIKKWNEDITEELETNLQTQFQLKSKKMMKMINENHNKRILN